MEARRRSPDQIAEELRRLQETSAHDRDRMSLLHEVSVYQEELIVQNEALLRAQSALEETRDRFVELYDFAPIAYLTLDANGIVLRCNLTAAALIGRPKQALEGLPFLGFVVRADRPQFLAFLRGCRSGQAPEEETELTIRTGNGSREVQLLCRQRHGDSSREYFTSLIDVTERNRLERERTTAARECAALAGRLISVQEEERHRIARNLHDDIGQQLTVLRLKLDELAHLAARDPLNPAVARVREMVEALDRRVHTVATELRPSVLDLGIATAVEQFVQEWSAILGIPATFHSAGIERGALTPAIETHVYRIAQEALNNVSKHATAHHVTVLLEQRGDGVVLIVEDDGRGFDPAAARDQKAGLGLVGIRERAQIIGGRLEVEAIPGEGTSLFLHVPAGRPSPAP